jgi:hypothetical protein
MLFLCPSLNEIINLWFLGSITVPFDCFMETLFSVAVGIVHLRTKGHGVCFSLSYDSHAQSTVHWFWILKAHAQKEPNERKVACIFMTANEICIIDKLKVGLLLTISIPAVLFYTRNLQLLTHYQFYSRTLHLSLHQSHSRLPFYLCKVSCWV